MIHGVSRRTVRQTIVIAWILCALAFNARPAAADARLSLQKAAQLVQAGRLDEAAREAQRAMADPDTRAAAHSVLGAIRLQQHRLEESAALFETAIRLDPRLLGAKLNLAQVRTLQGQPQAALALVRQVLAVDPANAAAWAGVDELARSPDGAAALIAEGARLAKGGAPREAIALLERAATSAAPSYELQFNLAGAHLLDGDPARALDAYDAALALEPAALPALRQAALVAERRGEYERSLSYWLRAKKADPDDAGILLGFGRVCLRMDLLDDAEPALEQAARLRPDDPAHQYTLAAVKVGKRQFEAAQQLLEPMVAARPADAHLQYALGSVLYIQGRLDEAKPHLEASVRLAPEQLVSHYYLALVERDGGDDAAAMARLEKLLARHPDHADSHEALGGMLVTAQRYDDAERHLRRAVALSPKSVKGNYQLGLLLTRTGRREEGERQLRLATTLRDEDAAGSRLQLRLMEPNP